MKDEIRNFIYDVAHCSFIADPRAANITRLRPRWQSGEIGFINHHFTLGDLRYACGEGTEAMVLDHLDKLAAERKIKIFSAEIPARVGQMADVAFSAEVGTAIFELVPPTTFPKISEPAFYVDHPLDLKNYEFGGCTIEKPSQKVAELRVALDAAAKRRFGSSQDSAWSRG